MGAPKVINKKQFTYIIPSSSPYFSNPVVLFELYKPPTHTTKPPHKPTYTPMVVSPPSSPPSQTLPPSSPNPFDGLEQEEVEQFKIIIPTKYKKQKKPLPSPSNCKESQATVRSHSVATFTQPHSLNTAKSL